MLEQDLVAMTEILREELKKQYKSIRKFSAVLNIPSTTITNALQRNLAGTPINILIDMCNLLNIDINELISGNLIHTRDNEPTKKEPAQQADSLLITDTEDIEIIKKYQTLTTRNKHKVEAKIDDYIEEQRAETSKKDTEFASELA